MKLTHKFAEMTPDKRPQDPHMDGTGLRFETMEHGGEYPDTMPQAIKLIDAEGRSCRPNLIKIDRASIAEKGYTRIMDSESQTLTREEFASLLSVGDMCAASIPFEHELRLTRLGYVADRDGRLRMTIRGSARIAAAGFENRPRFKLVPRGSKQASNAPCEAEYFFGCDACGGQFDMRDLARCSIKRAPAASGRGSSAVDHA